LGTLADDVKTSPSSWWFQQTDTGRSHLKEEARTPHKPELPSRVANTYFREFSPGQMLRSRHNSATTLFPTNAVATRSRGKVMRDIRCDLQERANVVEEQIRAIYAHFEKVVQQLQSERDARVAELQGHTC
jgi:hypothetical protein